MKYLVAVILACICCSSLVYGQARRHYGHLFPIIADASPDNPIERSGKGRNAILNDGDEKWNSVSGDPHCNGAVYCISDDIYRPIIGGEFDSINGQQIRGIGRYRKDDDSTFTEIGGGISGGAVRAIYETYESGHKIFAAGNFTTAGGISVNNITYWDDNGWHAMGTGTNSTVLALTLVGDLLYVGGNFTRAGDSTANYIAIWNIKTNQWSPIIVDGVNGMDGGVACLTNDY
ncbi:MAG TPA: hypothetical protein VFO76_05035, partial [Candidatus Kapabacteria bacterium]|nr:hypothetical protein [Candidatus Kapabacteria bacterium]